MLNWFAPEHRSNCHPPKSPRILASPLTNSVRIDRTISLIAFVLTAVLFCSSASSRAFAQNDIATVGVPESWRKVPSGKLSPVDGYSWYRAAVFIPDGWKDTDLLLHVESLDDARATFFNGSQVSVSGTFPPQFRSGLGEPGRTTIPASQVKAGNWNVIAIRVYQSDPRPNFSVAPPALVNTSSREGMRLNGKWQYLNHDSTEFAAATPADFGIKNNDVSQDDVDRLAIYRGTEKVEDLEDFLTRRNGDLAALNPQAAEQSFEVPDDLQFQLVLSEPHVTQPLFMTWDEKGRMWVVEYRQYPEIAGVRMLSRDKFLRSVYDKIPEPPPHGAKGRDRISIHEDTNGDGVYDKHSVFVDGLNLATSVAIGRGGAFVANPPYLLFYPDENGDDIPDGDPEVLLEGFGLEDSHSVINSMRFGPDGWLYGAQGSTVTAEVRRPGSAEPPIRTSGQQIWRYHPESRRFEVFAEGGGNSFGVEIDSRGHIYSGHNGGNTRGFHYVQGGYYRKGFSKHGALSNPFAFGYFEAMKHAKVPRFTHNFIIYEEGVLPDEYQGRLFGIEPLQGQVVMSDVRPDLSSFQTEDISRVVKTDDQWFRPVDIKAGPDGCIYVADMYEQRIDHASHYAGRIDRTNGRIYRLRPKADQTTKASVSDPLAELKSKQRSHRQTALRLIGDSPKQVTSSLLEDTMSATGQTALEQLWALNLSGGLNDESAQKLLKHAEPAVREWTVRLMCDRLYVSPTFSAALEQLATTEPNIHVRKQLAASARRISAEAALPIIGELLKREEDADDIHQPLMIWWAMEAHVSVESTPKILELLIGSEAIVGGRIFREHIAQRLTKRYVMTESRQLQVAAASLLTSIKQPEVRKLLLAGVEESFKGRSLSAVPEPLLEAIELAGGGSPLLRLRRGDEAATKQAIADVGNSKVSQQDRLNYLAVFAELRKPQFMEVLLDLVRTQTNPEIVSAAITGLQGYESDAVPAVIIERFEQLPTESRRSAETLLSSRTSWVRTAMTAIADGRLTVESLSSSFPRHVLLHQKPDITEAVQKHWPDLSSVDTAKIAAQIDQVNGVLSAGSGNPKQGKPLFMKHCGRCHQLFEEGGQIGPDLTAFRRDDTYRMLQSIVAPSLEIREGFETYTVVTADGRLLTGFKADEDSQVMVLRGVDGQNVVLKKDDIDEVLPSKVSLMPQEVLKPLNNQQLRDLFAYLRSSQPVNY